MFVFFSNKNATSNDHDPPTIPILNVPDNLSSNFGKGTGTGTAGTTGIAGYPKSYSSFEE